MGRSSPASATSAGSSWARTPLSSGSAGFRLPAEVPQQRSADHCSISWLSLTRRRAVAHPRPRAGRGAASEPLPTAAVGHPRPHRGGAADAADGELLVAVLEDAVEQLGADRHDPACGPHWTSTCCQRRRVRPSPPARSRPAARPAEPPPSRAAAGRCRRPAHREPCARRDGRCPCWRTRPPGRWCRRCGPRRPVRRPWPCAKPPGGGCGCAGEAEQAWTCSERPKTQAVLHEVGLRSPTWRTRSSTTPS